LERGHYLEEGTFGSTVVRRARFGGGRGREVVMVGRRAWIEGGHVGCRE
jgi:hypothetical protein